MFGISFLFIFAAVIQIALYIFVFTRLAYYTPEKEIQSILPPMPAVSVVICARNEAKNLKQNLPFILSQHYPNFEVIVVNDASSDDTFQVLKSIQKTHKRLRIVDIKAENRKAKGGKKNALTQGIKASKHEVLVLTDADCRPAGRQWISTMAGHFNENSSTEIVLGFGPYRNTSGWLNKCIQYETVYTAMHYLSLALLGQAYMGVGRNMAYKKSLFYQVNGFAQHQNVMSGDDDLFINQVADYKNTVIEIKRNAFCYSTPPGTWNAWYKQKKRHLSTGTHYEYKHQVLLGMSSFSHFLFYTTGGLLLYLENNIIAVLLLASIRMVLQLSVFKKLFNKQMIVGSKWWIYPLFIDVAYTLYFCIFAPSLFLHKDTQWK